MPVRKKRIAISIRILGPFNDLFLVRYSRESPYEKKKNKAAKIKKFMI